MNIKIKCLICQREKIFRTDDFFCPDCEQPMLIDPPQSRNPAINKKANLSLERFGDFLPLTTIRSNLSLGEGHTPLLQLRKIQSGQNLWAKMESSNPTLSFKDRGTVVVVHKALELGFTTIGTVSTGNMASSTAAYGARAGLKTLLLVKKGSSPRALLSAAVFGPEIIEVDGDYGQLFYQSYELGRESGIYFANSIDPLRIEGYKLTAFEVCEQLGRAPDFVYVPLSSGGHLLGLYKGFKEFWQAGLADKIPVIIGVQAAGCAPVSLAFQENRIQIDSWPEVRTIAHSISNPKPPAGNLVLKLLRENNGFLAMVRDEEMIQAQKLLAELEGIFVQPESAATLAAYFHLKDKFHGTSVLVMTGYGLKAAELPSLEPGRYHHSTLEELPAVFTNLIGK